MQSNQKVNGYHGAPGQPCWGALVQRGSGVHSRDVLISHQPGFVSLKWGSHATEWALNAPAGTHCGVKVCKSDRLVCLSTASDLNEKEPLINFQGIQFEKPLTQPSCLPHNFPSVFLLSSHISEWFTIKKPISKPQKHSFWHPERSSRKTNSGFLVLGAFFFLTKKASVIDLLLCQMDAKDCLVRWSVVGYYTQWSQFVFNLSGEDASV